MVRRRSTVRFRKGAPVQEANSNASKILGSHSGSQVGFGSGQPSAVAQIVISGTLWYSIALGISLPSLRRGRRRSLRTFSSRCRVGAAGVAIDRSHFGVGLVTEGVTGARQVPALTGESETAESWASLRRTYSVRDSPSRRAW